jgi:YHS domain-containing protein
MKDFILPIIIISAMFAAGCKKDETAQSQTPVDSKQVMAVQSVTVDVVQDYIPTQNQYGTVTSCPVMGEKVTVGKNTKAVKYKGKIYFLCCPTCLGQFKSNPEKYTVQKSIVK